MIAIKDKHGEVLAKYPSTNMGDVAMAKYAEDNELRYKDSFYYEPHDLVAAAHDGFTWYYSLMDVQGNLITPTKGYTISSVYDGRTGGILWTGQADSLEDALEHLSSPGRPFRRSRRAFARFVVEYMLQGRVKREYYTQEESS